MNADEPPLRAVLDTNVLFPITLCDLLLRMARAQLYAPRWSDAILDELERNLVRERRTTVAQAQRRRSRMERSFPRARVTAYESLIPAMTNDPKDRHVLAAAVHAGADVIVTQNLRDFPDRLCPHAITAQSADTFLQALLVRDPDTITRIVDR